MKPRQLPQGVLARWLDVEERVEALVQEAAAADAEVARLRMIMRSGVTATAEEFAAARDGFEAVHLDMQRKRARADAQGRLLAATKRWIEGLAPNTKLVLVHPAIDGQELGPVRTQLRELRAELAKLRGFPPASTDIEAKVRGYVTGLARSVLPQVRNYAAGQGPLDVKWPGDSIDVNRNIGLLLFAALDPAAVGELVIQSITKEQPLSALEHAARVAELESKVDVASYALAALTEKAGGEFDPELRPEHVLGVRIGDTETGVAAA